MAREKILISGASGFIGKQLLLYLKKENCDVLCISKNPIVLDDLHRAKNISLDQLLRNRGSLELDNFKPDTFLHLGWAGIPPYTAEELESNLEISLSLFKIATDSGVRRILGVGSCYEYGDLHGLLQENAEIALTPSTQFGKCKIEIHKNLINMASKNKIDHGWVRIFYGYGTGQRETSFIPKIIKAAVTGSAPFIDFPNKQIDLIHVFDIARGLKELLITREAAGVFNLGSGTCDSLLHYADVIYGVLKIPQPVFSKSVNDEPTSTWADIKRIEEITGWRPQVKFEDAISKLVLEYL